MINGYLLNKGAVHILNDSDTIEVGETAKFTYRAPGLGTNTQLIDLTEQDVMNIADAIIAQVERGDDRCIEIKTTGKILMYFTASMLNQNYYNG